MQKLRAILSLSAWLLAGSTAMADSAWDHGHKLVIINCTRCHAVELTGSSPLPPAPPFREVAKNYTFEELIDGFLEGLAVRHKEMPEWQMSDNQANDIATYILSLNPGTDLPDNSPEAKGFALLEENCARCHAIGTTGASPLPQAPVFRDVVKRYDPAQLEEALAEGIVTGHNDMPEFEFTPEDVTAIVAYLEHLRGR